MLKAQLEFGWWSSYSVRPPSPGKAATALQIPTHSGQVFRIDAGRDSDLKPAPTTTKIVSSRSTIAALIWAFRWIMVLWMASAGRRSASRAVDYPHVTARHSEFVFSVRREQAQAGALSLLRARGRTPPIGQRRRNASVKVSGLTHVPQDARWNFNSRRGVPGGSAFAATNEGGWGWGVGP